MERWGGSGKFDPFENIYEVGIFVLNITFTILTEPTIFLVMHLVSTFDLPLGLKLNLSCFSFRPRCFDVKYSCISFGLGSSSIVRMVAELFFCSTRVFAITHHSGPRRPDSYTDPVLVLRFNIPWSVGNSSHSRRLFALSRAPKSRMTPPLYRASRNSMMYWMWALRLLLSYCLGSRPGRW